MIQYRDAARARGELVGVGISTFVEPSGGVGFESATVRVERTGEITVLTGASSHGQGHETVLRRWWPTSWASPWSTWRFDTATRWRSSRASAPSPAAARSWAVGPWRWQRSASSTARQIAAHLLEAAAADIVPAEGGFAVAGVPDRKITWRQIAATAYGRPVPGLEPGLQETVFFDPGREAWGFGAHVALVRIDRETGKPTLEKLVLVDDCGVILNPMIVEGQVHGGVAQDSAKRSANRCSTATTASRSPPRCWITQCRAPAICRRSSSARP